MANSPEWPNLLGRVQGGGGGGSHPPHPQRCPVVERSPGGGGCCVQQPPSVQLQPLPDQHRTRRTSGARSARVPGKAGPGSRAHAPQMPPTRPGGARTSPGRSRGTDGPVHGGCLSPAPKGMPSYCTRTQGVAGTKAQNEIGLVSGLQYHWYRPVTSVRHGDAGGQAAKMQSNGSQRNVNDRRQAVTIGPVAPAVD